MDADYIEEQAGSVTRAVPAAQSHPSSNPAINAKHGTGRTRTESGPLVPECEAGRRNKQALYILENNWGCGVIDVWELARLLRGEPCECEN